MDSEIRNLLHRGAATPSRQPVLGLGAVRSRSHGRGLARAVGVTMIVALGAAVLVLGLRDPKSDHEITAQESARYAATPGDDWLTFTIPDLGISVRYPPGWQVAKQSLTPHLTDPKEVLSLGTLPMAPTDEGCAHVPTDVLERLGRTDAFIMLLEQQDYAFKAPPKPDVFSPASGTEGSHTEIPRCIARPLDFNLRWLSFDYNGRGFYALVAVGGDASDERQAEPWQVLNNLQVSARG